MKNKFIIFYTVFTSAIFVFALAFFGVNIYKEYSQGQSRTSQRYNSLVYDLKTYTSLADSTQTSATNIFSESSLENVKSIIGDFNDFSFIQIDYNNLEVLKYPKNASPELTVSNLTKTFETSFSVSDGEIKITCNSYLLRPSSIYYYAKISFFIILIMTIVTIILIFYINSKENFSQNSEDLEDSEVSTESSIKNDIIEEKKENQRENEENQEDFESEKNTVEENTLLIKEENEENEENEEELDISKQDNIKSENQEINDLIKEDSNKEQTENKIIFETSDNSENISENENITNEEIKLPNDEEPISLNESTLQQRESELESKQKNVAQEHKESENEENEDLKNSAEDNPKGLFNPVTGFGWESYLQTRLENEINRAISSEIDLSVFLIQLPEVQFGSKEMKDVCDYLAIQFQFKDLLFEYKGDSLVAIKISMNLDEALNFADKIHAEIKQIVNEKDCFIGISTRSIRIVSAERLLQEAQAALEHAKTDEDSQIIAFRVDAEKYMQYLEQNQQ